MELLNALANILHLSPLVIGIISAISVGIYAGLNEFILKSHLEANSTLQLVTNILKALSGK